MRVVRRARIVTKPEAFAKLDRWCTEAARLNDDTEASIVHDMRNPDHLKSMSAALGVEPIHAMEWVLKRREAEKKNGGPRG